MSKARIYPGADRSRFYGGKFEGATFANLEKILLHSTETSPKWGCPGYNDGKAAPTFTINPWAGYRKVWQHFDVNESARALVNPTTTAVSENKDNVCQIEIIGYSDAKIAATYGFDLRNLTSDDLDYIATVLAWIAREWDVPLVRPALWPSYPASYGASPARMTSAQYDAYRGVLGHLHASGNTHGDPTLDIDALLSKARAINTPTPAPSEEDDLSAEDTARLKAIETTLNNLASAEAGRYTVATGRYSHLAGLSQGIAEKVGAPVEIDEAALAAGVAATVAPLVAAAVTEAAKAQGIPNADTLADAVVTRLGAKLAPTPEEKTA